MHPKKRQWIGLLILGVSVLTAAGIQVFTGAVVQARTIREDNFQGAKFSMTTSVAALTLNPRYAFPLAACCLMGLVCLAWPSRKPPRLPV